MKAATFKKWQVAGIGAQIISLIAIPVVLAWATNRAQVDIAKQAGDVQKAIATQSVQKDYMVLAIGILSEAPVKGADKRVREWAADILQQNSPAKFPAGLREALVSQGGTADLRSAAQLVAPSGDSNLSRWLSTMEGSANGVSFEEFVRQLEKRSSREGDPPDASLDEKKP